MIKTVFLDLDDTILDFHLAERHAISETLLAFGYKPCEEALALYSEINKLQWQRLERGEATREEILVLRFDILFEKLGIKSHGYEAKSIYEEKLQSFAFIIPGALETVISLHKKYDLYLASNGTARVQDGRLRASGISKYFKDIFISERIGYNKPKKEFFLECIKRIDNFDYSEAIIIGDSITSDIRGGRNAGIRTCLYNPKGLSYSKEDAPDHEIRSLSELEDLLSNI